MEDEQNRTRLLWIVVALAVLSVIGVVSLVFDSTLTLGRIVLVVLLIPVILLILIVIVNPAGSGSGKTIVKKYADKHVTVTVPPQGFAVQVLRLPAPPLAEMRSLQDTLRDEFTPRRVVLNVVVARRDNPDLLVTQFAPPIELRAGYTTDDLKRAQEQDLKHPQFGFWDGCRWILFTEKKHQLRYEPADRADLAGYAVVTPSAWADPPIAFGP